MAVSFSDLRLAFEFVSSGGSGGNETYLDGQSGKIYWHSEFYIAEAESGRVVVTAKPKDIHLNPAGSVHGGLAATMLDSCMGLAIQSTLEKGVGSTTLGQSDGLDGGFCVPTQSSADSATVPGRRRV